MQNPRSEIGARRSAYENPQQQYVQQPQYNPMQGRQAPVKSAFDIKNWFKVTAVIIGIIFLISFVINYLSGAWISVFIDNDQTYFGKGTWIPFTKTMTIKDVYYIQPNESGDPQASLNVLPLRDETIGLTNDMTISKEHILYYVKLDEESPLMTSIKDKIQQGN